MFNKMIAAAALVAISAGASAAVNLVHYGDFESHRPRRGQLGSAERRRFGRRRHKTATNGLEIRNAVAGAAEHGNNFAELDVNVQQHDLAELRHDRRPAVPAQLLGAGPRRRRRVVARHRLFGQRHDQLDPRRLRPGLDAGQRDLHGRQRLDAALLRGDRHVRLAGHFARQRLGDGRPRTRDLRADGLRPRPAGPVAPPPAAQLSALGAAGNDKGQAAGPVPFLHARAWEPGVQVNDLTPTGTQCVWRYLSASIRRGRCLRRGRPGWRAASVLPRPADGAFRGRAVRRSRGSAARRIRPSAAARSRARAGSSGAQSSSRSPRARKAKKSGESCHCTIASSASSTASAWRVHFFSAWISRTRRSWCQGRRRRSCQRRSTPPRLRRPATRAKLRAGVGEAFVDVVILADLVVQVGVVRRLRERGGEQLRVAARLGLQRRGAVAVVPEHGAEAAHRQRVRRLVVHMAFVAHAARQHPRQPAGRDGHPDRRVELAVDAQRADEVGHGVAQRQQLDAGLGDPFVGVDDDAPVGAGQLQRGVAGGGEVVAPFEVAHARARGTRERDGGVGGAGVEHHHLVDAIGDARQRAHDARRLVAHDHHQRDLVRIHHCAAASASGARPARWRSCMRASSASMSRARRSASNSGSA